MVPRFGASVIDPGQVDLEPTPSTDHEPPLPTRVIAPIDEAPTFDPFKNKYRVKNLVAGFGGGSPLSPQSRGGAPATSAAAAAAAAPRGISPVRNVGLTAAGMDEAQRQASDRAAGAVPPDAAHQDTDGAGAPPQEGPAVSRAQYMRVRCAAAAPGRRRWFAFVFVFGRTDRGVASLSLCCRLTSPPLVPYGTGVRRNFRDIFTDIYEPPLAQCRPCPAYISGLTAASAPVKLIHRNAMSSYCGQAFYLGEGQADLHRAGGVQTPVPPMETGQVAPYTSSALTSPVSQRIGQPSPPLVSTTTPQS